MGSVGQVLNMTGHEKDSAIGMAIGAIANVCLNFLLIPRWGASGAAVATGVSVAIWNIVLAAFVYRRLGLNTTVIRRARYK